MFWSGSGAGFKFQPLQNLALDCVVPCQRCLPSSDRAQVRSACTDDRLSLAWLRDTSRRRAGLVNGERIGNRGGDRGFRVAQEIYVLSRRRLSALSVLYPGTFLDLLPSGSPPR